ncbi:MAG: hypothetical protein JW940_39515 [Polyangiaceae bacterium]|nr:hypothetical protein [Polyangiaceae bacterium]
MPCANCGAPTQLVSGPYLNSSLGLYCGYCRRSEPLPPDAAERVRYLQWRLMQLGQARENDEAPLRTVARLKRAWVPVLVVFFASTVLQISQTLSTVQAVQKAAPQAVHDVAFPMAIGLSMFAGYLFGYVGMLRGYRRAVKPLLRARPPMAAGLAIRCRSCGGDLPNVNAPEVVCRYCGAPNQLDKELTTRTGELLQAEISAYQARAAKVYSHDAFRAPTKAFYRWGAAGAVVALVVCVAAIQLVVAALGGGGDVHSPPRSAGP